MDQNLIVGRKPLLEALEEGRPIDKIFVLHGVRGPAITAIYTLAKKRGVPVRQSSPSQFREMVGKTEVQGVVGVAAAVTYLETEELLAKVPEGVAPFILVLDEIEDPQNLGALIRSALCFGVHGVVIPRHHAAAVTPVAVKASAGAALRMPVARVANITRALETLKGAGCRVVGTVAEGGQEMTDNALSGPIALVVGSEGKGIRRLVRETCDVLVRIPTAERFDSLNASVAGGIVMYETMRRRGRN